MIYKTTELPIAVTVPDAIRLSGIGRSKLYEVFKSGAIKPRKHGKRTLIIVSELELYLNSLPSQFDAQNSSSVGEDAS